MYTASSTPNTSIRPACVGGCWSPRVPILSPGTASLPLAGASIGVLAKIESAESVEHLEEILDAVDGAMVARGDLGAELPVEEVPYWQNLIVQARICAREILLFSSCILLLGVLVVGGCGGMRMPLAAV